MTETKPFTISKQLVYQAWLGVKANKGSAGIDDQSVTDFEANLGRKSGSGLSLCTTFVVYEDKKKIFSECKACPKSPLTLISPTL